ncbi:MAG: hypothetical protein OXJ62_08780 [Spirochaetaceae bacterium]|nr:hypothetical protein [Spirochaetaceae bacterium]
MGQSTFTADGTAPFVFDDNWDNFGNLRPESRRLSATNADGVPVVPLTEEQKFTFDTQGWLCIPGVLDEADLEEMRAFCYRLKDRPESLPEHQRTPVAGPLEKLLDHPVVVGFCNEFLAYHRLDGDDHYGFRFETSDAPEAQVAVPPRVRRSGQHRPGHAQSVRPGPGLRR